VKEEEKSVMRDLEEQIKTRSIEGCKERKKKEKREKNDFFLFF